MINNHNNNDTIILSLTKTYSIILTVTYGKQTTIRLNDNEDDKNLSLFQNRYILFLIIWKKVKEAISNI